MTPVTLVTSRSAAKSPQTDAEWRELYDDLKGALSLGDFQRKYGIGLSRAAWNKFERHLMALSDDMKAELRRAVGLPMTVAEATAQASPDAAVWQTGTGSIDTIVLVAGTEPVTLHVNGAVTIAQETPTDERGGTQEAPKRIRGIVYRPCASQAQESRRMAIGATWRDVIESGLKTLEEI